MAEPDRWWRDQRDRRPRRSLTRGRRCDGRQTGCNCGMKCSGGLVPLRDDDGGRTGRSGRNCCDGIRRRSTACTPVAGHSCVREGPVNCRPEAQGTARRPPSHPRGPRHPDIDSIDGRERFFRQRIGWRTHHPHPSLMQQGDTGSDSEPMLGVVDRKDHCQAVRRNSGNPPQYQRLSSEIETGRGPAHDQDRRFLRECPHYQHLLALPPGEPGVIHFRKTLDPQARQRRPGSLPVGLSRLREKPGPGGPRGRP